MRGDTALVLVFVGLVFAGPAVLTAQDNNALIMRGLFSGRQAGQPLATPADPGDLLEFVDGSVMHGGLKGMDAASGLRWESPAAKNPIDLQPGHIDSIRFARAAPVTLAPASHLRFVNGDDLFGSVTSLDDDHFGFSTWFGGALTLPRASVQSITFLSSNYTMLYDGPSDASGWIVGGHNPESWTFHDGSFISGSSESPGGVPGISIQTGGVYFISGSSGTLGRDFKLSGSSTVEFDLAWSDVFELLVNIYSDAVDHFEYGNSYTLDFTRDQVSLRHSDMARQIPPRNFGSAPLPIPAGKNKIHIIIQSNKEEDTVAVFVDHVLAKRWKDQNGFSATGGGLLFQQMGGAGAAVKLSNFKISQWQGGCEPETSAVMTNVDVIRFINHDQAAGKIAGINGGKVTLALGETLLQIPLQRVTQINFAATPVAAAPRDPWEVRACFPYGGSLSFQLEKWSGKEVSGRSAIFGPLAFQPGQIRQLEFNLDRPKAVVPVVSDKEFEGLDE
jgi:hypothetical protein